MNALLLALALAAPPSTAPASDSTETVADEAESTTHYQLSYVLKVSNRSETLDAIVAETRRHGGWFASLSNDDSVDLRVPVAKLELITAFIEEQGLVADRSMNTTNYRRQVAELDARLESQREMVEQYLELMEEAGPTQIYTLERGLTSAIDQVEAFAGQRRMLMDRAEHAAVRVTFQFRDRRRANGVRPSPFAWVNDLDVRRVVGDLRSRRATTAKRPTLGRMVIPHMASYRLKKEFRATSPDGVVVRTRAFKHKPKADLAFWTEAVQTHLLGQGYVPLRDESLGEQATWLEWAVPSSTEELSYITVIRPAGGRLDLVEIAGTAEHVEARRADVLGALKKTLGE